MAKGKYKASLEKRSAAFVEAEYIDALKKQVVDLQEENEKLKKQAEQDSSHHAYQIARMYEDLQNHTSPIVQEREKVIFDLKEQIKLLQKIIKER
jgi:polyhydroxyalkanoate synthesis regulator phasin